MNNKVISTKLLLLGVLLSSVFLWLALRNVKLELIINHLKHIDYQYVALCSALLCTGIFFRSYRWHFISNIYNKKIVDFFSACSLGVFTNLIIPARAGEIVRVLALVKLTNSSIAKSLSSSIFDRLADMLALLIIASSLSLLFPIGEYITNWLFAFLTVAVVIITFLTFYISNPKHIDNIIIYFTDKLAKRWEIKTKDFLIDIQIQFKLIPKKILSFKLLVVIGVIACIDYLTINSILLAFKLDLPYEAPLVLWVFLAAGSALPSAPGYVGLYQLAAVWTLSLYSIEPALSVAVATILQLTTLATATILAILTNVCIFTKKQ